jgi:hypothetical protein
LTEPTGLAANIAAKGLTVTGLSGTSRTYNGSAVDALSGTAALSGLVNGESLTLGGTTNGTLASLNAGSEAVTTAVTIATNGTSLASNYTLTQPTLANVNIAQAPLTVSANNLVKTFGSSDPLLTFTASGFVSGDSMSSALTGSLSRATGETSGIYTISEGALSSINYSLVYSSGTLKIVPLVLTGNAFVFPTVSTEPANPVISSAQAVVSQAVGQLNERAAEVAVSAPGTLTTNAPVMWGAITIVDDGILMPDDSLTP